VSESIRVLLADEQPAVRGSVRRVLEAADFTVCAEAGDATAALEAARRERPDVCIIGLRMEGSPHRAIAQITDELPGTDVIVLTASRMMEDLIEAVRAGALGYLLQDMDLQRLPDAVHGVLRGEAAVPRVLVTRLMREIQAQREGRVITGPNGRMELTPREWQILNLTADRLTTAEIAQRLVVSPVTVRRHVSQTLTKLGVPDREAAVELLDEQA
jgi:DNA-binding NarL/FixJ family response regulator